MSKFVSIEDLKKSRESSLKEHKLDPESIEDFKKKLKKVSEEESKALGKQLFDIVNDKKYKDADIDKVLNLIYNGADVCYVDELKGNFPLLMCARRGHIETTFALIRAGADVKQSNYFMTTPVMDSARYGHDKILKLLVYLGADINARSADGDTAIMSAKRHNRVECFNFLQNHQAHLSCRNYYDQGLDDIPGNVIFSNLVLESNREKRFPTEEDVKQLISDAEEELKKILEKKYKNN